jgi:hypothetical protein
MAKKRTKTISLVTGNVSKSKMFQGIKKIFMHEGIELEVCNPREKYKQKWGEADNLITWGVKWPTSMYKKDGRNVLFLENGLLKQGSGIFIDTVGYFGDSSMVVNKDNQKKATKEERENLYEHIKKHFGWEYGQFGGDRNGPVLVALQMNGDASMRHYFPLCNKASETLRNKFFLELIKRHIPEDIPLILRGHPKERNKDYKVPEIEGGYPDNWAIENGGNIKNILPTVRGVVTVCSTVGTEALGLGLPVATLGNAAFVGAGATHDCSQNPSLLSEFGSYTPNMPKITNYLCSVLRHQISYHATEEEVANNPHFIKWFDEVKRRYKENTKPKPVEKKEEPKKVEEPKKKEEPKKVEEPPKPAEQKTEPAEKQKPKDSLPNLITCVNCGTVNKGYTLKRSCKTCKRRAPVTECKNCLEDL